MDSFLYIPLPDGLVARDQEIFQWINSKLTNDVLDVVMPFFRNSFAWAPLYLFIVAFVIINFKKRGWWWFGFCLLAISCTDLTGNHLFKHVFERLRPCNDPAFMSHVRIFLGRCSTGFSFVSNHAINHFGIASFVFVTFRPITKYSWALLPWALCIGYAQIYVGVHYPFDVLCGSLLGFVIGGAVGLLFNKKYSLSSIS
ncbi:MAG: phosphatase PAP2 family protein [Niabella sp.]